jgi:acyl transferase domain-containing protein/acyl carrier protein
MDDPTSSTTLEAIAIIGMACRFPGASDPEAYWENLVAGRECISRWDAAEMLQAGIEPALLNSPHYVRASGMPANADQFDAAFFDLPPAEAELMDPQQRLCLECAWETFENAGYLSASHAGRCAAFIGASASTYLMSNLATRPDIWERAAGLRLLITNDKDHIALRVGHLLGLSGPCISIGTACSTSLVAVALACQSLWSYESDLALAGGVSVSVPLCRGHLYELGGIYAPDAHCRPFDANAQGIVGGSGVGLVLLRRASEAIADGDNIIALIRGCAVNNDGGEAVGYTAPSVKGQAAVIAEALATAQAHPDQIGYLEAHGTGTALGDPIEIRALTQAFRAHTARRNFCALGSVKANIGHLDAAAGVASLIKVAQALRHGRVPPQINFSQPNPALRLADSPFYIPVRDTVWPEMDSPRRAGVSSFGIGGTNAHAILQEAPRPAPPAPSRADQLLLLSARTPAALRRAEERLAEHLERHVALDLADAAYTLAVGRKRFPHRRFVVAATTGEAASILRSRAVASVGPAGGRTREVVFVFSGEHPMLPRVFPRIYDAEPGYRAAVAACHTALGCAGDANTIASGADGAAVLFVLQYALARTWMAWGIRPKAMVGIGVGQLVAACLAGVMTQGQALALAVQFPSGRSGVAPSSASPVPLPGLNPPQIPLVSAASGDWMSESEAVSPAYWRGAQAAPLTAGRAVEALRDDPDLILLDLAPDPIAGDLFQRNQFGEQPIITPCCHGFDDDEPGQRELLAVLGRLWEAGATIDWTAFHGAGTRRRVPLPTYPFERRRYWIEPGQPIGAAAPSPAATAPPVPAVAEREADCADWFYVPSWRRLPSPAIPLDVPRERWLVFVDACGVGRAIADSLRAHGSEIVEVTEAAGFRAQGDGHFALDPVSAEHYAALFDELTATGALPRRVVHCWSVSRPTDAEATLSTADLAIRCGMLSLLALCQAYGQRGVSPPIDITIVSNGLEDVLGDEPLSPAKAALLGPLKVVPREYPNICCRGIDIVLSESNAVAAAELGLLLGELAAPITETRMALRRGQRWVPAFSSVRLEQVDPVPRLRAGGVYLIVGGFGALGLHLALRLAKIPGVHLVLASRTACADETLEADDPRRAILHQIRALGATVLVRQADVTDEAAMAALLTEIDSRFGTLHGVIQAAGEADLGGVIQMRSLDGFMRPLAAKVTGTLVLHRLLTGRHLDFLVLCASLGTLLHNLKFGECGYVAANDFLAAYAHYAARLDRGFTVAINWTDLRGSGLSARAQARLLERYGTRPAQTEDASGGDRLKEDPAVQPTASDWLARDLLQGLDGDEAGEVLVRVLGQGEPQVVVSTQNLHRLLVDHAAFTPERYHALLETLQLTQGRRDTSTTVPVSVALGSAAPGLVTPGAIAGAHDLEVRLVALWRELLGVEHVGVDDDFFELGGDSLLAIRVLNRLNTEYGVQQSLAELMAIPTVRALAAQIERLRAAMPAADGREVISL